MSLIRQGFFQSIDAAVKTFNNPQASPAQLARVMARLAANAAHVAEEARGEEARVAILKQSIPGTDEHREALEALISLQARYQERVAEMQHLIESGEQQHSLFS
jgi:aldehyde:ferredoxin oxidoreductase